MLVMPSLLVIARLAEADTVVASEAVTKALSGAWATAWLVYIPGGVVEGTVYVAVIVA